MQHPQDQEFSVTRTIGRGRSRPGDVLKLRRALNRTGHGRFPQNPARNVTPGLMSATESFQREFGLEPDAVIEPGGPTERMMRIVERTRRDAGEDGVKTLAETTQRLKQAGLDFRPDPANPKAGMFVDEDGAPVGRDQLVNRLDGAGGAIKLAASDAPAGDGARNESGGEPKKTGKPVGPGKRGRAQILFSILEMITGEKIRGLDEIIEENSPKTGNNSEPSGARVGREASPDGLPLQTPPFPGEPPKDARGNKEEFPVDEDAGKPTLHVNPIPELKLPEMEIFPDQSDMLEQWLVQESRGKKDGQQKDVQFIIDEVYKLKIKCNLPIRLAGGGKLPEFAEPEEHTGLDGNIRTVNPGDEVKELVLKDPAHDHRKGGAKLRGSGRPDVSLEIGDEQDHFNIVDKLKDGQTPDARERRNFEKIVRLSELAGERGYLSTFGKSKGEDQKKWENEVRAAVKAYVHAVKDRLDRQKKAGDHGENAE